ncbi:hypothetical protein [Thioalkalivibrio sp. XN279]|uniref:hypothetical protein n=1 Tax=Thioalkalivibrio sp. XN279 TaxID=2714953 RepID=UPI00140B38FE|nr:hypothetical protein [Thioalkalivibrio sp. XN279]NHA14155.1 hypothetical protein [Thioalkalivibrio sp. XN279]
MTRNATRCPAPSYRALLRGKLQTQLDGSVRAISGFARQNISPDYIAARFEISTIPTPGRTKQDEEISMETVTQESRDGSQYVEMSFHSAGGYDEEPEVVVFSRRPGGRAESQVCSDPPLIREIPREILFRAELGTMLIETAMEGRHHVDAIVIDPRSNGAATRASIRIRPYKGAMLSTYRARAWEFEYEYFSLDDPDTVVVRELEVITSEIVPLFSTMDWGDGSISLQYTIQATRRMS